jgi:hypothetical protein
MIRKWHIALLLHALDRSAGSITLSANALNDRLRRISEVVGAGQGDIKKGLKIEFIGEEGVDAGGLRKEWFLLLIREVFDEAHGE